MMPKRAPFSLSTYVDQCHLHVGGVGGGTRVLLHAQVGSRRSRIHISLNMEGAARTAGFQAKEPNMIN